MSKNKCIPSTVKINVIGSTDQKRIRPKQQKAPAPDFTTAIQKQIDLLVEMDEVMGWFMVNSTLEDASRMRRKMRTSILELKELINQPY